MDMSDSESSLSIIVVVPSMVEDGLPIELNNTCAGLESAEVESAGDESVLLVESSLLGDSMVFLTSFKRPWRGWTLVTEIRFLDTHEKETIEKYTRQADCMEISDQIQRTMEDIAQILDW